MRQYKIGRALGISIGIEKTVQTCKGLFQSDSWEELLQILGFIPFDFYAYSLINLNNENS